MWAATIAQLKSDPSELWREIDWVAKLRLIEQYQARHDMPTGSAKLEMIDLLYHDVDRSRGLFYKLQATDQARRTTTDQDIATAMTQAPQTTRARLRGAFVKRAAEQRRDYTVDWVHLKLNDQAQRAMMLRDPFRSHDDRVDRLIESL
jgi:proteasome accessory factor A